MSEKLTERSFTEKKLELIAQMYQGKIAEQQMIELFLEFYSDYEETVNSILDTYQPDFFKKTLARLEYLYAEERTYLNQLIIEQTTLKK